MRTSIKILALSAAMVVALTLVPKAHALPITSIGAGSAVTSIDAAAGFENAASLFQNPYIEDGIQFSRTNLNFNNNGCGFAGCAPGFVGFSGNYMYGVSPTGVYGYFTIKTTGTNVFKGLEFQVSSGYNVHPLDVQWSTWLSGVMTGSGTLTVAKMGVFGVMDLNGFDEVRYSSTKYNRSAPAFDNVNAQYTSVPEPSTLLLLGSGIFGVGGLGFMRRRFKA